MYTFNEKALAKVEELRGMGIEPYPNGFEVTHLSTDLHQAMVDVEKPEDTEFGEVCIAGRLMFRNRMGKVMFLRIMDRGDESSCAFESLAGTAHDPGAGD